MRLKYVYSNRGVPVCALPEQLNFCARFCGVQLHRARDLLVGFPSWLRFMWPGYLFGEHRRNFVHVLSVWSHHYRYARWQPFPVSVHDLCPWVLRNRHKQRDPLCSWVQQMSCRLLLSRKLNVLHCVPTWHIHHVDGEYICGSVHNVRTWLLWQC